MFWVAINAANAVVPILLLVYGYGGAERIIPMELYASMGWSVATLYALKEWFAR
jgi:hypothetical protein